MTQAPAVVLDTNALLLPFLDGIDLLGALEALLGPVRPVVPAPVAEELRRLAAGDGRTARAARAAADHLLPRCEAASATLPGDDGVLEVARRLRAAVLTNDRRLQQECRRAGLTVVAPRERALWLPFGQ